MSQSATNTAATVFITPGEVFVTTDALAARAYAEGARKRSPGGSTAPYDPVRAQDAAEAQKRRVARQDGILSLRDRGKITAAELRAAHEIACLVGWTESDSAPMARSQFRERMDASTDPGVRWLWLLEAEHTRYAPWREWARKQPACKKRGAFYETLETLTRLFAVEGWGVRRVEKDLGLRHGRAVQLLRSSLHHYATIAGWQSGAEPPEVG